VVTKQAVVDVGLGKYIEDEKTEEKEKETSSSDDYFSSPAKNPVITKSPTAATSKIAPDFSIVPVIISSLPNLDSTYYGVVGNKTLTYSGLATGDYVNITYDITNGTGSKKLNENDLYRVDVTLASPTNGGDMNNVYLLAYDGTNTFETIRTGYFGEYSGSPYTGTDGLKSASSLTFYATTAGTYTVNLKLYNVTAQAVALDIGDFTINVTGIAAAASENELVEALANPLVTAVVLNTDTTLTDDFEVPTGKTLILGNGVDLTLDTSGKTITITGAIQGEGGTPIAGPLTFGSLTNLTKDGAVTITGTATGVDIVLDSDGGSRNVLLQGDLVLATGNSLLIDGTPNIYKKDETWSITVEEGGEFTFSSTDIITSSGVATVGPTGSFQPATGGSVVFSATTGDTGWDFTIQGDVETSTAGVVLFDKFHLIVEEGAGLTLNDFQLFAQTANVGPTLEVNGTLTFTAVGSLRIDNLVDTGSIILGANAVLDLTDAVDNGLGVYLPAAATDQTIWLNWLADSILVDAEIGAQILVTKEQFVAFTDQTYALTTGLAGVSGGGTITLVRQAGSATITADPTTWTWAPYNGDVALTA
ncbi:MAG: hypothetical protein LBN00_04415, partial [Oscillospiraceae bacterium]|jgi:hypothetical protein|nr:hypothetical protein [Oscillospiraceae bacterium]